MRASQRYASCTYNTVMFIPVTHKYNYHSTHYPHCGLVGARQTVKQMQQGTGAHILHTSQIYCALNGRVLYVLCSVLNY